MFSAGGLECLAASVSYAISYVYMDRFLARRGVGATVLSACQLAAAAVMLAIALGVSGVQTPHVTAESIAAIAILGIVGTGFAYVLNYQIITSEGATVASTVTYLLPVVAIVLGVLVLNENVTATMLAGIALVLAGIALTRRQQRPARKRRTQSRTWPGYNFLYGFKGAPLRARRRLAAVTEVAELQALAGTLQRNALSPQVRQ